MSNRNGRRVAEIAKPVGIVMSREVDGKSVCPILRLCVNVSCHEMETQTAFFIELIPRSLLHTPAALAFFTAVVSHFISPQMSRRKSKTTFDWPVDRVEQQFLFHFNSH